MEGCSWFCPLAAEWGNVAEWAQAVAALLAVYMVQRVWRQQAALTRTMQETQAALARGMHEEQAALMRQMHAEQSVLAGETQKQSLRPRLQLTKYISTGEEARFKIWVRNTGLGPAVIKQVRLSYQNVRVEGIGSGKALLDNIASAAKVPGMNSTSNIPSRETWISKDVEIELLAGSFVGEDVIKRLSVDRGKELASILKDVRVEIDYESVFKEPYTEVSDSPPQDDEFSRA